jgi:hypothetical protein
MDAGRNNAGSRGMGRELEPRWRAAPTERMSTIAASPSIAAPNGLCNQVADIFTLPANPCVGQGIEHPLAKRRTPPVADLHRAFGLWLNSFSGSSTRECP